MSPTRLTIALSISVVLIGGAMWSRFGQTSYVSSSIVAVENLDPAVSNEAFLADFISTTTPISTTSAEPLSQTDIIGRQLFLDFMALKSSGQITPSSISSLANKYAENLVGQNMQVKQISLKQVVVVTDSEENFIAYSKAITNIRNEYKNIVTIQYSKEGVTDTNNQAFSTFMDAVGKLYEAAAGKLLATKVPVSLSQNHVELINNYLENAKAMEALANMSDDPMSAVTALKTQTENTNKERGLLLKIQQTMVASGIIFNSDI